MSISGIKLLCDTTVEEDAEGNPSYATAYRCSEPVNGHLGATVFTPVGTLTESTFNLTVQQAVADRANAETSNVEEFVAGDVYGGRI